MRADSTTGLVTNVQRFSIHDGPGIRSTVFLKGCSLRCFWCHNPEALSPMPEAQYFLDRCIGCEACITACPHHAQARVEGRRTYFRERCQACGRCAEVCYAGALVMTGRTWTPVELVDLLLRDREFYRRSGGGVTLSGGEPALQPKFSREVLELCRRSGLHTAIETAAHCPWEYLAAMLPYVDLVILDLKTMDSRVHQAATGAPNNLVLENARRLSETHVPLVIRTPVVPGVNDAPEAIHSVAEFVRSFPHLHRYELMPFHGMGWGKYASLGLEYRAQRLQAPGPETLETLVAAARASGIANVKLG